MYAKAIQNLIQAFKKLPSVGNRTAERFVFSLLKSGKKDAMALTLALEELLKTIKSCSLCSDFSDTNPCPLCKNEKRNPKILCVVEQSQDRETIEKMNLFTGRYHILRGLLTPDDPEGMEKTKTRELFLRVEQEEFQEIILALNPTLEGETTMMFLERNIKAKNPHITISRLARGIPMGANLEYADEITLKNAFSYRRERT